MLPQSHVKLAAVRSKKTNLSQIDKTKEKKIMHDQAK